MTLLKPQKGDNTTTSDGSRCLKVPLVHSKQILPIKRLDKRDIHRCNSRFALPCLFVNINRHTDKDEDWEAVNSTVLRV